MSNCLFALSVRFFVEPIGAMSASTFAAISSFEVILLCKALITLRSYIIITFFGFYSFFWKQHSTKVTK